MTILGHLQYLSGVMKEIVTEGCLNVPFVLYSSVCAS